MLAFTRTLLVLAAALPAIALPDGVTPASTGLEARVKKVTKCGWDAGGMPAEDGFICCVNDDSPPNYCYPGHKCSATGTDNNGHVLYSCICCDNSLCGPGHSY